MPPVGQPGSAAVRLLVGLVAPRTPPAGMDPLAFQEAVIRGLFLSGLLAAVDRHLGALEAAMVLPLCDWCAFVLAELERRNNGKAADAFLGRSCVHS